MWAGIARGMASVGAREPRPSARSRRITRRASGHRRQTGPRCPLSLLRRTGQICPALSAMRTLVVFYRRRSLSPAAHLDGGRARTACAVAATRRARMLLTTDARCVVRTGGWSYSPESDLRVGILTTLHVPRCWTASATLTAIRGPRFFRADAVGRRARYCFLVYIFLSGACRPAVRL